MFDGANLTVIADVNQDKLMYVLSPSKYKFRCKKEMEQI